MTCHNLLAHLPFVFCLNVFRSPVPKIFAPEWISWIWYLDWLLMNPDNVAIFFCTWKIVPVPAWGPWAGWSSLRLRGALWYNPYQKRPAGKGKKVLFAYGKGFNYNLESKHERKRSKNRRKMKYIKITAELNFIGFKHCRMQRKWSLQLKWFSWILTLTMFPPVTAMCNTTKPCIFQLFEFYAFLHIAA